MQPLHVYFELLHANLPILCIGVGMGIYRCAHEWLVWFNEAHYALTAGLLGSGDLFVIADMGKVVGVVFYVTLCYAVDRFRRNSALLVLPSLMLMLGYVAPSLWALGIDPGPAVFLVGLVVGGMGAGMLFAQWIEVCGRLAPLRAMQTLALSYVVRTLVLPLLTDCGPLVGVISIMVLAGSSFIQVELGSSLLGDRVRVSNCPAAFGHTREMARQIPGHSARSGYAILLIWVCVFTFSYGLGEAATGLGHSVVASGLGGVLPALLVLVLAAMLGDRFDWNVLYIVSIPLMAAGLIAIEFFGVNPSIAQVLVSAGMVAFELLVYTMACAYARHGGVSAMLSGGCVRVAGLIFADAAVLLIRLGGTGTNAEGGSAFGFDISAIVAISIFATLVMGFFMFLPSVQEHFEQRQIGSLGYREARRDVIELRGAKAGLSPREMTVFRLMVEGKMSSQISEELFISNGAVRAHCSRIYEKFGVHSRKDFDELMR